MHMGLFLVSKVCLPEHLAVYSEEKAAGMFLHTSHGLSFPLGIFFFLKKRSLL